MTVLTIVCRWLHIVSACVALGGVFFARIALPAGLRLLEPEQRELVLSKIRRSFKIIIHASITLLILTGIYNSWMAFGAYKLDPPLLHALWGTHIFLALLAFCLLIYLLAGEKPPAAKWKLLTLTLVVLLLAVAASSTLKWAHEKTVANHSVPWPDVITVR